MTSFSQWLQGEAGGSGADQHGVLGPEPVFRNAKDRQLSAWGVSPDVQHPDGYLGTMGSSTRRSDKLLDTVHRQNHRSYSRGVHKGERVNPGDYYWPDEFNLQSALVNQVTTGMRFPTGSIGAEPVRLTNDGKAGPRGVPRGMTREQQEIVDLQRRHMLKSLLPQWR